MGKWTQKAYEISHSCANSANSAFSSPDIGSESCANSAISANSRPKGAIGTKGTDVENLKSHDIGIPISKAEAENAGISVFGEQDQAANSQCAKSSGGENVQICTFKDAGPTDAKNARVDFDERAAIAEFDSGIPREWAEGFATLQTMPRPPKIKQARWDQIINDAGVFLDEWGALVYTLGWTPEELFGVAPSGSLKRRDMLGLVPLVKGNKVVAVTSQSVTIRVGEDRHQVYVKADAEGAMPLWGLT